MNAHIVYCHPSKTSCTHAVCDAFIRGVRDSGHSYTMTDLYACNFSGDITEAEYLRDADYRETEDFSPDVRSEQEAINKSNAIVFVYPVFWTEAPAKLKGWFDRVWSFGFAYGPERRIQPLETGLILCCAGHSLETLEQFGFLESMKKVMLNDRLNDRVKHREFVVYDETSHEKITPEKRAQYIADAYRRGKTLFTNGTHTDSSRENSLDGVYCLGNASPSTVPISSLTVFSFRQKGATVWAEYQGGGIEKGMLLATYAETGIQGTWQHRTTAGKHETGTLTFSLTPSTTGVRVLSGTWHNAEGGTPAQVLLSEATSEV